ncbi:MAG: calcium/sodium antiporter [Coriobacteriia bacterium]|nr:calcium/sodium antiporter [Coriobacteriia bacterium]
MMAVLSIVAGLALLTAGGEGLVRAAVSLARRSGLPTMLIGVTIVGAATSMPELVVSLQAAIEGNPGIAVGNVVGSNIANLALGLGVMGVLAPFTVRRRALWYDIFALIMASIMFLWLGMVGTITRGAGMFMVLALVLHLWSTYRRDKRERDAVADLHAEESAEFSGHWPPPVSFTILVIATAMLVGGARLLLNGAIPLAEMWGVSDTVIGASVVAIGTSLPEIATTAAAALRREHEVALGNLMGSSLFNLLGILGATAVIQPIPLDSAFVYTSGGVALGVVLLSTPWLNGGRWFGRTVGWAFLGGYLLYIVLTTGLLG